MLLSMVPDLELIALDSCECFDSNKGYVRKRLSEEKNEAVRKLLEADYNFLDEIQTEMSSARQFLFAVRFRKEKEEQVFNLIIKELASCITKRMQRMTKRKKLWSCYTPKQRKEMYLPFTISEKYMLMTRKSPMHITNRHLMVSLSLNQCRWNCSRICNTASVRYTATVWGLNRTTQSHSDGL